MCTQTMIRHTVCEPKTGPREQYNHLVKSSIIQCDAAKARGPGNYCTGDDFKTHVLENELRSCDDHGAVWYAQGARSG
jgi:hypothetical protein